MLKLIGLTSLLLAGPPAPKWEGPWVPSPGGRFKTTIYYGPWQCTRAWLNECASKCAARGHPSKGCIWIADLKTDWEGSVLGIGVKQGGRLAITHCCCDSPEVPLADRVAKRSTWDRARKLFRESWGKEFGDWPKDSTGTHYPGHHIEDILHGGDATGRNNVLPVPRDIHETLNAVYPACYGGQGPWSTPGPERPYTD